MTTALKLTGTWFFLIFFLVSTGFSQSRLRERREHPALEVVPQQDVTLQLLNEQHITSLAREIEDIFDAFQKGLEEGNITPFSRYLGTQVYMNLPGGKSGYFSGNQASYVLQNYLSGRRVQSFYFSTYAESASAPYATGPGHFESRGSVENVQVYVALAKVGDRWFLSQINIY